MNHCISVNKIGFPESCQFGIIVEDAKRTQKVQVYIRSKRIDSLGRTEPFCTVLQILWSQTLSANLCPLASLSLQNLSSSRYFFSSYLRDCCRYRTNREYSISHSQWTHPSYSWTSGIPSPRHIKNISVAFPAKELAKPSICTRPIQSRTFATTWITLFRHRRCGYDPQCLLVQTSNGGLRTARTSEQGLQPQIPWKTFLCASAFQRRTQGLFFRLELRAGNVHPITGSWNFLSSIIDKLPSTLASKRIRPSLEAACFSGERVRFLDERNIGYVIVASMSNPLKARILSAKFHKFAEGWEAAEFS